MKKRKLPYDRAFYIKPITKGFRNKIVGYVVSDGRNDILIDTFGYFIVDTNQPLQVPIIRKE